MNILFEIDKQNTESIDLFKKYIKNMLLFNDGFLNPKYCSVQQLNLMKLIKFE